MRPGPVTSSDPTRTSYSLSLPLAHWLPTVPPPKANPTLTQGLALTVPLLVTPFSEVPTAHSSPLSGLCSKVPC